MMIRFGALLPIILFPCLVHAAAFSVHAPTTWKKVVESGDDALYVNLQSKQNELVAIQVTDSADPLNALASSLEADQLTKTRAAFMGRFGLKDYFVNSVSSAIRARKYSQISIDSMYRDLSGRTVQMIERQYVLERRIYSITYLIHASTVADRDRVSRLMDNFRPSFAGSYAWIGESLASDRRMPASEVVTAAAAKAADTLTNLNPLNAVINKVMTKEAIAANCANVPEERRTTVDDSFIKFTLTPVYSQISCFHGVASNIWESLKNAGNVASGVWSYATDSAYRSVTNASIGGSVSSAVSGAYKFATDPGYRAFTTASAGAVVAEAWKDPKAFALQIASSLGELADQSSTDFACLSSYYKLKTLCELATNLVPAGLLLKTLSKAPLAKEAAEAAAKLAKDAVAKFANKAAQVADAAKEKSKAGLSKVADLAKFERRPKAAYRADAGPAETFLNETFEETLERYTAMRKLSKEQRMLRNIEMYSKIPDAETLPSITPGLKKYADDVQEKFGVRPLLKNEPAGSFYQLGGEMVPTLAAIHPNTGQRLGGIVFERKSSEQLYIHLTRSDIKGGGISGYLFDQALARNPGVKSLGAELGFDNAKAVGDARRNKVPCLQAIKESAFYKIAAKAGFTEVHHSDNCRKSNYRVEFVKP